MKKEHFKKRLEEEKTKLESEMGNIGRKNLSVPGDWEPASLDDMSMESDLADQADVILKHESDAAILADLEARYDTILAALSKIEKDTYGMCEVCGKKIEEARLEADPSAATCVLHK